MPRLSEESVLVLAAMLWLAVMLIVVIVKGPPCK